jgi:hypothetical protein
MYGQPSEHEQQEITKEMLRRLQSALAVQEVTTDLSQVRVLVSVTDSSPP